MQAAEQSPSPADTTLQLPSPHKRGVGGVAVGGEIFSAKAKPSSAPMVGHRPVNPPVEPFSHHTHMPSLHAVRHLNESQQLPESPTTSGPDRTHIEVNHSCPPDRSRQKDQSDLSQTMPLSRPDPGLALAPPVAFATSRPGTTGPLSVRPNLQQVERPASTPNQQQVGSITPFANPPPLPSQMMLPNPGIWSTTNGGGGAGVGYNNNGHAVAVLRSLDSDEQEEEEEVDHGFGVGVGYDGYYDDEEDGEWGGEGESEEATEEATEEEGSEAWDQLSARSSEAPTVSSGMPSMATIAGRQISTPRSGCREATKRGEGLSMGAAGIGEATALNVARAEHDATFAMNQKIGDIATHLDTGGDTDEWRRTLLGEGAERPKPEVKPDLPCLKGKAALNALYQIVDINPSTLLTSCVSIDGESMEEKQLENLKPLIADPNLSVAGLMKGSRAAAALCRWLRAVDATGRGRFMMLLGWSEVAQLQKEMKAAQIAYDDLNADVTEERKRCRILERRLEGCAQVREALQRRSDNEASEHANFTRLLQTAELVRVSPRGSGGSYAEKQGAITTISLLDLWSNRAALIERELTQCVGTTLLFTGGAMIEDFLRADTQVTQLRQWSSDVSRSGLPAAPMQELLEQGLIAAPPRASTDGLANKDWRMEKLGVEDKSQSLADVVQAAAEHEAAVRAAQAAAGALGQKGVGRSARDEAEALVIKLFEDASGSRSDDAREAKIEQIMTECSRPPLLNVGKQR